MQKSNKKPWLNSLNQLRIVILLGLLFIGPNILAQSDSSGTPEAEASAQNINPVEEDHDTKKLDKLLIDYNQDQEKVLKDAEKINQNEDAGELTDKELGAVDSDERPALTKADLSFFDSKSHQKKSGPKKVKYAETIRVALEPLQGMSEMELVKLLRDNTKGSKAAVYIERFPKLAVFTVRLIKDKEALPGLARILDDEDRLIHFSGIMLMTIVFAFLLKRFMKREGRTVPEALGFWFFRFLIISSLRLGILIYFYSTEIEPTFHITTKTFF